MLLREEQTRTAEIDKRLDWARKIIERCDRERQASVNRQALLTNVILLRQSLLNLSNEAVTQPEEQREILTQAEEKLKPARLGKQHYRMLHAIRSNDALSLAELAAASGVLLRRAKLQMAEDAERGMVTISGGLYELTPSGADVLKRFEDYRRSNDIPLPLLDPLQSEDDPEEADPETQAEEEEP